MTWSGMPDLNDLKSLVTLNRIEGFGATGLRKLLDFFESPQDILQNADKLAKIPAIAPRLADRIVRIKKESNPSHELELAAKEHIRIISIFDELYPANLKNIFSPPILLYVKGELLAEDIASIAIVGSRRPTLYGRFAAENLATDLAGKGLTVVSGMARGVDTASHKGALKVKGRTIAVLGSGLDVVYPAENRSLAEQIANSGAVISEFPMGTRPLRKNFPRRNRIISGLSLGVVVVEAAQKSGSLITASFALDQGREVFAVPGKIDSYASKGTHSLIKQGAKLVEDSEDIIEELSPILKECIKDDFRGIVARNGLFGSPEKLGIEEAVLKPQEEKIYSVLSSKARHIDEIIRDVHLSVSQISSILTKLEIKNLVKELPGKMFVKMST